MASFTLDDIRAAAEAKYGSTDIHLSETETVHLQNPLRLGKKDRDKLGKIQDEMSEEGADQLQIMSDAILLVAKEKELAKKLLEIIGDDLAELATIFENYSKGSQVGEASASQD